MQSHSSEPYLSRLQLTSFWFLPVWDPGLSGPRLAHLLKSPSQKFCHLFRTRALAENCKISLRPGGYTRCWFEMTQSWFGMRLQRLLMVSRWVSITNIAGYILSNGVKKDREAFKSQIYHLKTAIFLQSEY